MTDLVLISGWGHDGQVWQSLQQALPSSWSVQLLEWPETLPDQADIRALLSQLMNQIPSGSVCCGWSLGGQLATQLVAGDPQHFAGLMTICSNPRYVAGPDWDCAMAQQDFQLFAESVNHSAMQSLRRFRQLVARGALSARDDVRQLSHLPAWPEASLQQGLLYLQDWDTRPLLKNLQLPQAHCFTAYDALVPVSCAAAVAEMAGPSNVWILEQAGHCPLLSHPAELAEWMVTRIEKWCAGNE